MENLAKLFETITLEELIKCTKKVTIQSGGNQCLVLDSFKMIVFEIIIDNKLDVMGLLYDLGNTFDGDEAPLFDKFEKLYNEKTGQDLIAYAFMAIESILMRLGEFYG